MGGDGRHLLCLETEHSRPDPLPAPQQGHCGLTSADGIPGEGHTCMGAGSKFRSGVTGLTQVAPRRPVASSRRKTRHVRGVHSGSPSVVQLHEESGDSTGGREATAGQRAVLEKELLCPAAKGAGTRSKTSKAQTAHDTNERVQARASEFVTQAAGAVDRPRTRLCVLRTLKRK